MDPFLTDAKQVLIRFLHQEPLPRIFFKYGRIGLKLFELLPGRGDLLLVIFLTFLQLNELGLFTEMTGNQVAGVKKYDPDDKPRPRQEVSVLQERRYSCQDFHLGSRWPPDGDHQATNYFLNLIRPFG